MLLVTWALLHRTLTFIRLEFLQPLVGDPPKGRELWHMLLKAYVDSSTNKTHIGEILIQVGGQ